MSPRVGRWPYSTDHKDIGTLYFPLEKASLNKGIAPSRFLHTNRESQYLYFYGKPNDMSDVRSPTDVDLKAYNLFLFRVLKDKNTMSPAPVVLDQTSLDEQLSKGLLGWANKDPHRFAYGVQSETGENLLIIGDTASTPSLVNGSSQSFTGIYDDMFSSKYSLYPAAKSTTKITFSNQTFPNKFIGDLDFDFEVVPYKAETKVAREPLRSSDVNDSESFKKSMSGVLLQALQKLAIAGVVGSVTTFGMSDVALAAGSYEEALKEYKLQLDIWHKRVETAWAHATAAHNLPDTEPLKAETFEYAKNLQCNPPVKPNPDDYVLLENKLSIPEEKASSPRNLLRPQVDEKVEPSDSISVIPNQPDSPRQPDPIVQEPAQGAGNDPQVQQVNNQRPGDLSEILGNHEAAQGAADRARDRVRAGMSL